MRQVDDVAAVIERLEVIKTHPVPNYFGPQRFGFHGNNLNWANRMAAGESIRDKKIKGFALSAARSFLFNQVVSERIKQNYFSQTMLGEVYILAGSQSYFSEPMNEEITTRLNTGDIQLSAPLFGKGEPIVSEQLQCRVAHVE